MKPLQLLLTLGLVGVGIFVYDVLVRGRDAPTWEPHDVEAPIRAPEDAEEEELPGLLTLEGTGDDLWRDEMERRLGDLERHRPAEGRTTAIRDAGRSDDPSAPTEVDDEAFLEGVALWSEDGELALDDLDPETVQRFRNILEAVEAQRRRERAERSIERSLDRLGVSLSEDQRRSVIDATMSFQGRIRQLGRGRTEQSREERREAYRTLKTEYEETVRNLVPSAEADRIVQGVNRQAGGSGRRSRRPSGDGGGRTPAR